MATKTVKRQKRKTTAPAKAQAAAAPAVTLVGTYREKQLAWIKRHGVYNYPVSEGVDADNVKELWLYADAKARRHCFAATFVGVQTRAEFLAANPTYAKLSPGKGHAEKYLVFKTEYLDYGPRLDDSIVHVRTSDFTKSRAKKVAAAIKRYEADGEFGSLATYLPSDLAELPRTRLRVCEAAVQLDFTSWLQMEDSASLAPFISQDDERFSCVYECADGKLFTGDSLVWLRGVPSNSIDMVFADPPYSIGKAEWDCFASHEEYLHWCEKWIAEVSRVLKENGTCYICGFSEILADVKYRAQHLFKGCRWIVWHYKNKANLGNDWGRSHESILHFRKSKTARINVDDIRIPYSAHTLKYPAHPQAETSAYGRGNAGSGTQWMPNERGAKPKDVFDIPTTCNGMGEKTPHPTQKPEELVRKLVLASSKPGEVVLDPFSGSGTTAVVAQQLHRKWLACDMNAQYNEWAIARLRLVADRPVEYWIEMDRETSKRRESIR